MPASTDKAARKSHGVYYTPAVVAQYIVRHTLAPLVSNGERRPSRKLRILDPACGDGVFLREAYRWLLDQRCASSSTRNEADRKAVARDQLFGLDIDQAAIVAARQSLARLVLGVNERRDLAAHKRLTRFANSLSARVRCGDALLDECLFAAGPKRFDAIVGNPPYVNMRELTKSHGASGKQQFRERYACARRAFDLYVLFMERALELLRPGGMCGFIVPNKIATLDYALPCRRMLIESTSIERIVDVADANVFSEAGVYPYILIWRKKPPTAQHRIRVVRASDVEQLRIADHVGSFVPQSDLSAERGLTVFGQLDVESRVPTAPLGDRATLHSGTTGFQAEMVARSLREREAEGPHPSPLPMGEGIRRFDFIVSGNIDRYRIRLGNVRFMGRRFVRPLLPDNGQLTENKRRLYRDSKIVIAGMTRRLEAAIDNGGLALGVQVYAVARPQDDPRYLLGLLNSKLMSYLFRIRFGAKRLAGGYLAVNKGQLEKLPVRVLDARNRADIAMHEQIVDAVAEMLALQKKLMRCKSRSRSDELQRRIDSVDRRIDRCVYELYGLTTAEIVEVDSQFVHGSRGSFEFTK